jgi:hypothetical protein
VKSVTVPAVIDHNRVIIEVEVRGEDGKSERAQAWVDNGNADLEMSRHLATSLRLNVACDDKECSAPPPRAIVVGGMPLAMIETKQAHIPLMPVNAASVMDPGMNAEINIPSTVLRQYDVLIDFPGQKFTIGAPGTIHFQGQSAKVLINAENGLIQVPSQIENKKYNLVLDLGSSIGFLSQDLFDKLSSTHPDWPHMTGAVGPANMWGGEDEPKWKLMRLDRVQYGPLYLTDVAVVDFPKDPTEFFMKRAGMPTAGLLGSQALNHYRIGLDYAHSMVYFDIGRTYEFPDFDVVGLTLRPENDGGYAILGVENAGGEPAAPGSAGVQEGDRLVAVDSAAVRGVTMGQVWSMLGGTPGQERKLTIERGGKEFVVTETVQTFLQAAPDEKPRKKK